MAAALPGEPDKARRYNQQALEAAKRTRSRHDAAFDVTLSEPFLDRCPDERAEAAPL